MVSLTIRVGETLVIGRKLALTVLGIEGNQVRAEIAAAEADIAIHRHFRRQRNNSGPAADGFDPQGKPTKIP